jgi:hypothetical protein
MAPRLLPADWTAPREVRTWLKLDRIKTRKQLREDLRRFEGEFHAETLPGAKRHRLLCLSELILNRRELLPESEAQAWIDAILGGFGKTEGVYPKRFRALSIRRRSEAKQKYAEFFFRGLIGVDCARIVASLV